MADKSFADYVKDVMALLPTVDKSMLTGSTNPDADKYREDPLWRSRAIKAAAEEEAKKNALDAALPTVAEAGGDSSFGKELNPYVRDFLDKETPEVRDARLAAFQQSIPSMIGGLLGIPVPGAATFGQISGMTDASGRPTYAGAAQAGQKYNNTPGWLQSLINPAASTLAAASPMGQVNPQQTSWLAAQYESLGYSPEASAGLAIASQESSQGQQGTNAFGGIGGSYSDGGDYGD